MVVKFDSWQRIMVKIHSDDQRVKPCISPILNYAWVMSSKPYSLSAYTIFFECKVKQNSSPMKNCAFDRSPSKKGVVSEVIFDLNRN